MPRLVANPERKWLVQVGKDSGSYTTKYDFSGGTEIHNSRAWLYYASINIGTGFKKRLVKPDGTVVARAFS